MTPTDRDRIEEMLHDPSLSCRAIARATGYSDWTIRKIARELAGDATPMRQTRRRSEGAAEDFTSVSSTCSWAGFGVFLGVLAVAIWAAVRWTPPLDPTDLPHGFYPNPPTERMNDEA